MEHEELTGKIIGGAYKVWGRLGPGFLESVYEKALMVELARAGLRAEAQKPIKVIYEGIIVGDFVADVLVDEAIIVELKAVRELIQIHEVKLVNYLKATGLQLGLLINFGDEGVEVRRKTRDLPRNSKAGPAPQPNPTNQPK